MANRSRTLLLAGLFSLFTVVVGVAFSVPARAFLHEPKRSTVTVDTRRGIDSGSAPHRKGVPEGPVYLSPNLDGADEVARRRGAVDVLAWSIRLAAGVPVWEEEIAPGVTAWATGEPDDFVIHWRLAAGTKAEAVRIVVPDDRHCVTLPKPADTLDKTDAAWSDVWENGVRRLSWGRGTIERETEFEARAIVALTAFTVSNTNDTGLGSLRQALLDANADPNSPHVITITATGTINLDSALPNFTSATAINGPGANLLTVRRRAGGNYAVFSNFQTNRPLGFSGMTIRDGFSTSLFGGGIGSLSPVTINRCVIRNNAVPTNLGGGGVFVGLGGVFVDSTFADNTAGFGGGIHFQNETLTLVNCTISGNAATSDAGGGGIFNVNLLGGGSGAVALTNCTVAGNVTTSTSGGYGFRSFGFNLTATYQNTIFTGAAPQIVAVSNGVGPVTVTSLGNNLCSDGSGNLTATGDTPNTNPLLGPLGDNGGPTPTHGLLPGSPASDRGNNGAVTNPPFAGPPFFDQRGTGFPRIQGAAVDIGACEFVCRPIALTPPSLSTATAGTPYAATVTATGGVDPYSFVVTAGRLANGITLAPDGTIAGLPTESGTFSILVRATDANQCVGEREFVLTVTCPTVAVGPMSLPAGTAAVAYGQTITATGTLGTTAFTVSAGTLPAGLTLSSGGMLAGTPTVTGTFNFTIRATDTNPGTSPCFGERAYSLVLTCPTIAVSPTTLPGGNAGSAYNQTVTASGGIAPYAFSISAGALPPGLTLATGGVLAGIPTAAGTFNFTITATDANGCTGTRSYSVFLGGVELALLYVADTDNSRIQMFDGTNWSLAPRTSGVVGSAAGQFRSPEGVAATRTNQIYVADTGNNRIHWYNGFTWSDFATIGSALNQVRAPQAVAIDVTGQFLFVADTGNNRILRFAANAPNSTGVVLANSGGASGQVNNPRGLAVDNLGNLFVADTGNSRILRIANATGVATADTGTVVTSALRAPEGVALDNDGNLYIADTGNSRILQLPGGASGTPTALATLGTALGSVRSAEGVTVTNFASGPLAGRMLLVGDTANSRVQARPLAGGAWSIVGGTGSGLGQVRSPSKIR